MSKPTVVVGTATKKSEYDNAIKFIGQSDIIDGSSSDVTLTVDDFGRTIVINTASNRTVYLPSVDSSHVGGWFKIIKLGSGNVTIDAADADTIMDGAGGGTLVNDQAAETKASVVVQLAAATAWIIGAGYGTWKTSVSTFHPALSSAMLPNFGGAQLESRLVMKEIATPATPASGYRAIYPKTGGVFAMLNSGGIESFLPNSADLLPMIGSRRWGAARASGTAILQSMVDLTFAGSGTTQYLGTIPQNARMYPTNTANSYRELYSQNQSILTNLGNNFDLWIRFYIETLTNSRYWLGLTDTQFAALGSDPASAHLAAFRYVSSIGSNWYCCTKDGSTLNAQSSGVAAGTSWTTFRITGSSGQVLFYINGTLVGTLTANLPSNNMLFCMTVETLAASYAYLRFGGMSIQVD